MKYGKKIFVSIFWVLLGVVLVGCELSGMVDEFWSGLGCGFIVVGALQIFRQIKYRTNEDYREQVDVAMQDERNRFLRGKAWAWAGYLFVIISAVGSIGLRLAGQEGMATMAACGMALLVLLYWASYMVLSRKY